MATDAGFVAQHVRSLETKNVVEPETITGLQIASCRTDSVTTSLDLSWNFIRGDSAEQLGASLATCASLQKLVLAYNTGIDLPKCCYFAIGQVHATGLDLSYNNVKPRAPAPRGGSETTSTFVNLDAIPRAGSGLDRSCLIARRGHDWN